MQRSLPPSKARKFARVEREYREAVHAFDEVNRDLQLELPAFHAYAHLLLLSYSVNGHLRRWSDLCHVYSTSILVYGRDIPK